MTARLSNFKTMTRRFSSILMVLQTLHVSAAEALRACESQPTHHQEKHDECEKPAPVKAPPTTCCDAMASCSTTLSIDGAEGESRVIPDRDPMIAAATLAPSALERTPEPPPPKGQA